MRCRTTMLRLAALALPLMISIGCESLPEWRLVVTERDDYEGVVRDTYEVLQQSFVRRSVRIERDLENRVAHLQTDVVITALSEEFEFARAQAFAHIQPRQPRGFKIEVLVLIEELEVGDVTATPVGEDGEGGSSSIEEVTGGRWVPAGRDEEFEDFLMTMLHHKLRGAGRRSSSSEPSSLGVTSPAAPLEPSPTELPAAEVGRDDPTGLPSEVDG